MSVIIGGIILVVLDKSVAGFASILSALGQLSGVANKHPEIELYLI